MLEPVISPSLTVNTDCLGKLKLGGDSGDVLGTLSDTEGRALRRVLVTDGGPCWPRERQEGPTSCVPPPAVYIAALGPKLWRASLTIFVIIWGPVCTFVP